MSEPSCPKANGRILFGNSLKFDALGLPRHLLTTTFEKIPYIQIFPKDMVDKIRMSAYKSETPKNISFQVFVEPLHNYAAVVFKEL